MANYKVIDGVKYLPYGGASGRNVYAQAGGTSKILKVLESQKLTSFHHRYIYNCLKSLNNPSSGFISKEKVSMSGEKKACSMNMAGSELEYFKQGGSTFITRLFLGGDDYDKAKSEFTMAGLYDSDLNDHGEWEPKNPIDRISKLHVAVSGEVLKIDEALQFLPKMIEKGYPAGYTDIRGKGDRKGFNVFYSPSKNAKGDGGWRDMASTMPITTKEQDNAVRQSIVDRLSASIELASGREVNWTIQGSGSSVYCEGLEQAYKRNPSLSLSKHTAHFFNPHTNPLEIERVLGLFTVSESSKGLYDSNRLSANNLAAMAKGNKGYQNKKIAESKSKDPTKSTAAKKQEARKESAIAHKIIGNTTGIVSTGALVAGAASYFKDVGFEAACKTVLDLGQKAVDGAIEHPVAAGLTALAFGIKLHKKVVHNTPKMHALATITAASILKDRRLDQLTESNTIKAAN